MLHSPSEGYIRRSQVTLSRWKYRSLQRVPTRIETTVSGIEREVSMILTYRVEEARQTGSASEDAQAIRSASAG